MFSQWLSLPAWAIMLTIVLAYSATGTAIFLLSFGTDGRQRLGSFTGIVPPFLGLPTLLFGLLAGFLASDVWDHARQVSRAVLDERDAALLIEGIDQVMATRTDLDALVHAYVRAVLAEEIPASDQRGSPVVSAALERLMEAIARPAVAADAGASVQGALLGAVARLSRARSNRLSLSAIGADDLKWATVTCLALLAQIGVGAVHLERPRAQIGAVLVFTGCIVAVLTLIAVCERPFRGPHEVSAAPLITVLPP